MSAPDDPLYLIRRAIQEADDRETRQAIARCHNEVIEIRRAKRKEWGELTEDDRDRRG